MGPWRFSVPAGGRVQELFISALVTFFVVIDPPGCTPIFASLTQGAPDAYRRQMATRSVGVAAGVLLLFALVGEPFLRALGISLDAFRIAGGVMLFLIALEMVFEKRTQRREARAEAVSREVQPGEWEDISVFPMGIPMIAGPGSIASSMLLVARAEDAAQVGAVILALVLILLLTLGGLLAAPPLMRIVGPRIEAMVTRVLGVILAALAAQFILDGVRASILAS
jgi:multiple antibiotic resistance protein